NRMNKPEIVVLGAGYGGIMTTVKLQKLLRPNDANITLVNKHDYHYLTTRLHEAAAGTIQDDLTRIPIRERSEEHTSELQSRFDLVCRLLLEKKNKTNIR